MATAVIGCMMVSTAVAQNGIIQGKLIDAQTKEPIVGATIRINESLNGTITGNDGTFIIKNLSGSKHTLRITHVSYESIHYAVSSYSKDLVIAMKEAHNNLSQVVVTGTGTHRKMVDSPVPISVIAAKDLKAANITTIEDALTRLNPSFSFSTTGISTSMTMNGVGQDYVLILVNGKRLTGEDTYQRINLDNVKRIEVLNGAASSLYGTDAVGGVINIITDDPKNTIQTSSNTRVSSKGRFSQSINVDANVGKLSSTTNYQHMTGNGWRLSDITTDSLFTARMPVMPFYSDNIDQQLTYHFTDKLSVYARGGFYHHTTERPQDAYEEVRDKKGGIKRNLVYTYDLDHQSFFYGAGMKYMIDKRSYIEADMYSDNYRSQYVYMGNNIDSKTGLPKNEKGSTSLSKRTRYYNATVKGIFELNNQSRLSVGTEYEFNKLYTIKTSSGDYRKKGIYNLSVFAQNEYKWNKHWTGVAGVRYIYHENFKSHFTGNLSLMYKVGNFNFRASYAGGYRTPELAKMYAQADNNGKLVLENPNLKAEKSNYYALNGEYNTKWVSISANAYINYLKDLIDYRRLTTEEIATLPIDASKYKDIQQYDNVARSVIKGFNLSATFYPCKDVNFGASYAFVDGKDKDKNTPLDKTVKHVGTFFANYSHTWKNYRLSINLNGRMQGKRYSVRYDEAPAFSVWDISSRHTFSCRNFTIEPGFGIENIFNYKDNRPFNYNYATITHGRAFFANVVIKFKK